MVEMLDFPLLLLNYSAWSSRGSAIYDLHTLLPSLSQGVPSNAIIDYLHLTAMHWFCCMPKPLFCNPPPFPPSLFPFGVGSAALKSCI